MEKHIPERLDERLNADSAPQCHLHVILGTDGLSMSAAYATGEVLALQSWLFEPGQRPFSDLEWDARRIIRDEPRFRYSYARVHCAIFHRQATLIPRRMFLHGSLSGYFKLLLPAGEYQYAYDEIPELDTHLVYATEPAQARLVAEFFPDARLRHLGFSLLRFWRGLAATDEHSVFVNFRNQVAQIAVFERQNLLFYNAEAFSSASDLLYQVLLAYDQFKLSPREIPVTVSGQILEDSELYRMLYRFIGTIRFAPAPNGYRIAGEPGVLPDHCHVGLFSLKNL